MTGLVIAFTIGFAALALVRLRWALLVLIALLPVYLIRFSIGPLPSTLLEVMIWIVAVMWLIKAVILSQRRRIPFKKQVSRLTGFFASLRMTQEWVLALGIALLLIAGTLSLIIAPDTRAAAGLWKAYIIEPVALFFIFITTFKKTDRPAIIFSLSLSVLATAIIAIYQKFTGVWIPNPYWAAEQTRRVTSVWGFPNAIGLFMAPLIPLFIDEATRTIKNFSHTRKRWKDVLVTCYLLLVTSASFLAIIWAKTTGALVALAGAGFIIGVIHKKTRFFVGATGLGITAAIMLTPGLSNIKQELIFADYSGGLRLDMWAEASELISDHPLLGTGLSSYKESIYRYRIDKWIEVFEYPHNILLNFWVELGLLGVLAFILLFYWAIMRTPNYPLLAAVLTILIHGLVDVPYFKNDLAVIFWLLLSLIFISYKKNANLSTEVNT